MNIKNIDISNNDADLVLHDDGLITFINLFGQPTSDKTFELYLDKIHANDVTILSKVSTNKNVYLKVLAKNTTLVNINLICLNQQVNFLVEVFLSEPNVKVNLNTLVIAAGSYKQDYQLHMIHDAKATIGNMYNVAIVSGRANVVLHGENYINKDMQKSESFQKLEGIILSKDAQLEIDPVLIIDNNDVKAGHSATVGKIDPLILYYIMSRGIAHNDAIKMIIKGKILPFIANLPEENQIHLLDEIERII